MRTAAGQVADVRAPGGMRRHDVLGPGIVCGLAAGVAMLAFSMISAAFQDVSVWRPLQAIGDTFVGAQALPGEGARTLLGLAVHLATSALLGVLFAAVVPRDMTVACGMGVGLGYALVAVAIMMMTVVPWVDEGFRSGIAILGGTWVIATAIFGAIVGFAPVLRRRMSQGAAARRDGGERVRRDELPIGARPRTT